MTRLEASSKNRFAATPPRTIRRSIANTLRMLAVAALIWLSLMWSAMPAFAQTFIGPQPLQLVNGWTGAPFGTSLPTVEEVQGIVQFRGAIAGGSSNVAFTLPSGFRPLTDVYIPVDLCNSANGRLHITPAGVTDVEVEGGTFSSAQCFTSLDGASFAPNTTGFKPLTLINGWTNAPFATSSAAVIKINGFVHFKGAIATTGTNMNPFVMPSGFRPSTDVYVPIDLCNSTNGRLHITPTGIVDVEVENGMLNNAQCFTSLDGAWFADGGVTGLRALTLLNGWINAPFSTHAAQATNAYGIVYFKGAIAGGTSSVLFTLPVSFRPVTEVYVPIDLCDATKGRLHITTGGVVDVEAENGVFSNAQCFTSLDGASFVQ
jgi:hypothetical protein